MVANNISPEYQDSELLIKVINKAKNKGFHFKNLLDEYEYFSITTFNPTTGRLVIVFSSSKQHQIIYDSIYLLFFDVTFAKAIFGDQWEQHLIELGRSKNKLEYIRKNVILE